MDKGYGGSSTASGSMPLFLPSHASMLPNQSIVTPPPASHYLSAADDLVERFQLHDSYHVMLQPFRKDLKPSTTGKTPGEDDPATPSEKKAGIDDGEANKPTSATASAAQILPRTYSHFLPPCLPGKVRPPKPPRSRALQARRLAAAGGDDAVLDKKERSLARAAAEWEKVSTTLRKAVMKPEYTAADIKPLDDEAIKGYQVEAGEVPDVSTAWTARRRRPRLPASRGERDADNAMPTDRSVASGSRRRRGFSAPQKEKEVQQSNGGVIVKGCLTSGVNLRLHLYY